MLPLGYLWHQETSRTCLVLCFPWDQHLLTLFYSFCNLEMFPPRGLWAFLPCKSCWLPCLHRVVLVGWFTCPQEYPEDVNTNLWAHAEIMMFLLFCILPMVI